MNKKMLHMNTLSEVTQMMNKVKSINEAISFDDGYYADDEMDDSIDDEMIDEPTHDEMPMDKGGECVGGECDIDEMNDIDHIREIALKGMLKYVKQSGSAEYETLKKIFQFCDKVNNDKGEEEVKK